MNLETISLTTIFITLFLLGFGFFLLRLTVLYHIDLVDFSLLSLVAILPAVFIYFPKVGDYLALMTGVSFPFIILFASLIFVLFFYIYILVRRINRLEKRILRLTQEVGILNAED